MDGAAAKWKTVSNRNGPKVCQAQSVKFIIANLSILYSGLRQRPFFQVFVDSQKVAGSNNGLVTIPKPL